MIPFPRILKYGNKLSALILKGIITLVSTNTSTRRYQFGCISIGTNIYALGGKDSSATNINSFVKYDTITNTFSSLSTSLPGARHGMGLCSYDNNIYMFSGNTGTVTNDFFMYDPNFNTWSTITGDTGRPTARHTCRLVTLNSGNFILWGYDNGSQTYSYNPVTKIWTALSSSPFINTYNGDGCTDGTDFYGINGNGVLMKYTVQTNTWSTLSTGTGIFGALCFNNSSLYCLTPSGILYRFNFLNNTWGRINQTAFSANTMNMLISLTPTSSEVYDVLGSTSTGVYIIR